MAVKLSDDTRAMVEAKIREADVANVDELFQIALTAPHEVVGLDELDDETRAAIAEAESQEGIPWDRAKAELIRRLNLPPR